jgi:hypothetical protein
LLRFEQKALAEKAIEEQTQIVAEFAASHQRVINMVLQQIRQSPNSQERIFRFLLTSFDMTRTWSRETVQTVMEMLTPIQQKAVLNQQVGASGKSAYKAMLDLDLEDNPSRPSKLDATTILIGQARCARYTEVVAYLRLLAATLKLDDPDYTPPDVDPALPKVELLYSDAVREAEAAEAARQAGRATVDRKKALREARNGVSPIDQTECTLLRSFLYTELSDIEYETQQVRPQDKHAFEQLSAHYRRLYAILQQLRQREDLPFSQIEKSYEAEMWRAKVAFCGECTEAPANSYAALRIEEINTVRENRKNASEGRLASAIDAVEIFTDRFQAKINFLHERNEQVRTMWHAKLDPSELGADLNSGELAWQHEAIESIFLPPAIEDHLVEQDRRMAIQTGLERLAEYRRTIRLLFNGDSIENHTCDVMSRRIEWLMTQAQDVGLQQVEVPDEPRMDELLPEDARDEFRIDRFRVEAEPDEFPADDEQANAFPFGKVLLGAAVIGGVVTAAWTSHWLLKHGYLQRIRNMLRFD